MRSGAPLFYTVERGPGPRTLDTALLAQARALGVDVRFNNRLARIDGAAILAAGPRAADAIAVGYHFETTLEDGFWLVCDDALAPEGYAYVLVMRGRGTLKSCMFAGFKQESLHVRRTVEAFERLRGLRMANPREHGGAGNFRIPRSAYSGSHPVAGEQTGFQDPLRGFGMRYAIASGGGQSGDLQHARQPRLRMAASRPGARGRCAALPAPLVPALVVRAPALSLGAHPLSQQAARRELQPRGLRVHLVPLRRRIRFRHRMKGDTR